LKFRGKINGFGRLTPQHDINPWVRP
jgi:hypothetical protein